MLGMWGVELEMVYSHYNPCTWLSPAECPWSLPAKVHLIEPVVPVLKLLGVRHGGRQQHVSLRMMV